MKKRVLSVLLCFVLTCTLFVTGCGKKDKETGNAGNDKSTPEKISDDKVVEAKFDEISAMLKKFFDNVEKPVNTAPVMKSEAGYDMDLAVEIGKDFADAYGLTGLESAGLKFALNVKEKLFKAAGDVLLNGSQVVGFDALLNEEGLLLNLPKYSKQYAKVTFEEMFGMSLEEFANQVSKSNVTASSTEIFDLYLDFFDKFTDCFKYQSAEENVSIGTGDYVIKAKKYSTKANTEEVINIINECFDKLSDYVGQDFDKYTVNNMNATELYLNYYEGSEKEFAVEFSDNSETSESFVLVFTNKGFCAYSVDGDDTEMLVYSVKETETSGKVVIVDSDSDIVINYSNLTDNSVDLKISADKTEVSVSLKWTDNSFDISFNFAQGQMISVNGLVKCEDKKFNLELSAAMQGMNIGKITLTGSEREYSEIALPEETTDINRWVEGFDAQAFSTDLQSLMVKFPFIASLVGGAMN